MSNAISVNKILIKVFRSSLILISTFILLLCLFFKWQSPKVLDALLASVVISIPPVLALHALVWINRRLQIDRAFAWMLLFGCLPLLAAFPAFTLAGFVPGKAGMLLLIGMVS